LLAEKEKLEAEVADLEAQKRTLDATLAKDAEVNAEQIAKITELTVNLSLYACLNLSSCLLWIVFFS
jgi:hypothetical protein